MAGWRMMSVPVTELLTTALEGCFNPGARASFDEALSAVGGGDTARLLRSYTGASRWFPPAAVIANVSSPQNHQPLLSSVWTCPDAARAVLLLRAAAAMPAERFAATAADCYTFGDAGEQQSWLRGLPVLPAPERFLSIAIDACRTNIVPLFEALACENPYPARFFPELNFNQLVLKAMFNGIRLSRIVGLADRTNSELARMSSDFADERRAAGRPVPPDIALALAGGPAT